MRLAEGGGKLCYTESCFHWRSCNPHQSSTFMHALVKPLYILLQKYCSSLLSSISLCLEKFTSFNSLKVLDLVVLGFPKSFPISSSTFPIGGLI